MKIVLTSIPIDDYDKALGFYTGILGFQKKRDIPLGAGARWVTVVSPEDPDGPELLLEPNAAYPAMKALKEALVRDGIPYTAFQVGDLQEEYERLKKLGVEGVRFIELPPALVLPKLQGGSIDQGFKRLLR